MAHGVKNQVCLNAFKHITLARHHLMGSFTSAKIPRDGSVLRGQPGLERVSSRSQQGRERRELGPFRRPVLCLANCEGLGLVQWMWAGQG